MHAEHTGKLRTKNFGEKNFNAVRQVMEAELVEKLVLLFLWCKAKLVLVALLGFIPSVITIPGLRSTSAATVTMRSLFPM